MRLETERSVLEPVIRSEEFKDMKEHCLRLRKENERLRDENAQLRRIVYQSVEDFRTGPKPPEERYL